MPASEQHEANNGLVVSFGSSDRTGPGQSPRDDVVDAFQLLIGTSSTVTLPAGAAVRVVSTSSSRLRHISISIRREYHQRLSLSV
jgi:hypothetical protein